MKPSVVVEELSERDWPQVRAIYLEGIETGRATFETGVPEWDAWNAGHLAHSRLVARSSSAEGLIGWAALSPVSARRVYQGVAEVSVYVARAARGRGVGALLLAALITTSEQNNIWTLQAGILAENAESLALHRRCGFREVGRRERIGKLHGVWRDTILLERRSSVVGVD